MIAHAAPPAPVVSAPAVSLGRIAVRVGDGTRRLEVQAGGRITARVRVARPARAGCRCPSRRA